MIQLSKGRHRSLWEQLTNRPGAPASATAADDAAATKELEAARKGRRRARQKVVDRYSPLISELARSLTTGTAHEFLLMEAGREAVVQALDLFDPGQGWNRFPAFARMFIERRMRQYRKAPQRCGNGCRT